MWVAQIRPRMEGAISDYDMEEPQERVAELAGGAMPCAPGAGALVTPYTA